MPAYYSDTVHRRTCVYRIYGVDSKLLYVGLTLNPVGRMEKHKRRAWWVLVEHIDFLWYAERTAAKKAERDAIHHERPVYNIVRPKMECC